MPFFFNHFILQIAKTGVPVIEGEAHEFSFFQTSLFTILQPFCSHHSPDVETPEPCSISHSSKKSTAVHTTTWLAQFIIVLGQPWWRKHSATMKRVRMRISWVGWGRISRVRILRRWYRRIATSLVPTVCITYNVKHHILVFFFP